MAYQKRERKVRKCKNFAKCGKLLVDRHTNAQYCGGCSYARTLRAVDRHAKQKRYRHDYQRYHAYIKAYLEETKMPQPDQEDLLWSINR